MTDIFNFIGAGSTLTLVALCFKLSKNNSNSYVKKDMCHSSMNGLISKIDETKKDLKEDIRVLQADVKELLKK